MLKAQFSLEEVGLNTRNVDGGKERRWISCGDYQVQDIADWRNAIIKRYGPEGVSELQVDEDGYWWFDHPELPDDGQIGRDLGITHSGPSVSSSSSCATSRVQSQSLNTRGGKRKRGLSLFGGKRRWRRTC